MVPPEIVAREKPPKDFIPFESQAINLAFPQRFEQIVQRYPNNIAVSSAGERITYQSLNEKANRLAHAIISNYGSESEPVAFILEHGLSAIVAMIGITKAGKAYVPVDPFYPPAWITHILDDTQADLVLTNNQNIPLTMTSLATPRSADVLNLDTLDEGLPAVDPTPTSAPANMAYILYTSGSTGKPKGVIHSHQDAMQNIISQANDLSLSPSDHLSLFISFGFEASRFSIYGALHSGGTLCLYDIRSKGVGGLPDWIAQEKISILLATPSTFRHMFNFISSTRHLLSVRHIVLGGEPVTSQDVSLYRRFSSKECVLVNVLGTTETGIITRHKVYHQTELDGHSVPSGYPIGEKHVELVDAAGHPLDHGQVGEIIVKCRFLSPGYWRLPALTDEKFSVDPHNPDLRRFHSGDLGRFKEDGSLEHLGRKDEQIKIRGFRVETAEIEAVIHQFEGVKNSAVIARETRHSPDEIQLVAYIEPKGKPSPSKTELRRFLSENLPDYMVPAILVFLDALPLTPTGKVKRNSLPAPEDVGQGQEHIYVPPRDAFETQLVEIWERVLRTKHIGIRDDYFELGGNSLLAAQLFTQIEKIFGKKLPLATLFQAPTVEKQAEILRQENWVPDWSSLVALRSVGSRPPLFFAAPVGGNVLSYRDLVVHLPPDQPCYGLQAIGLDGTQTVHQSVNDIAAHYVQEIITLQSDGPYYLAGSSFGGLVVYEMAQQLHDMDQQVALVVMFDAYGPNYPKRLPGTSRIRRKFYKYLRRFDTHFSNLMVTDWRGRTLYVRVKGQKLFNRINRRISNKIEQILHPLPRELRKVRAKHMGAAKRKKRYMREPRRFSGRLVLFRADKQPLGIYSDPKLGWGAVVGEDIEVIEMDGHHTSLIYEPRVGLLAEKLINILEEVQSSHNSGR